MLKPHCRRFSIENGLRRVALAIFMCLCATLCGCGRGAPRFVSEKQFKANAAAQTGASLQTLGQLRRHGVAETDALRVRFFFYTDARQKATALSGVLEGLDYSVEIRPSPNDEKRFLVTGWSTAMPMADLLVAAWTWEMCEVGYDHDCVFDGWGTNPPEQQGREEK